MLCFAVVCLWYRFGIKYWNTNLVSVLKSIFLYREVTFFSGYDGYILFMTVFIHNHWLHSYMVIVPVLSGSEAGLAEWATPQTRTES